MLTPGNFLQRFVSYPNGQHEKNSDKLGRSGQAMGIRTG